MTPDAAGIEAALAAGLRLHSRDFSQGPFVTGCAECGGSYPTDADFDAHVAAALLPVVTQAQAAERERVAQAIEAACPGCRLGDPCPYADAARIARADESGA